MEWGGIWIYPQRLAMQLSVRMWGGKWGWLSRPVSRWSNILAVVALHFSRHSWRSALDLIHLLQFLEPEPLDHTAWAKVYVCVGEPLGKPTTQKQFGVPTGPHCV